MINMRPWKRKKEANQIKTKRCELYKISINSSFFHDFIRFFILYIYRKESPIAKPWKLSQQLAVPFHCLLLLLPWLLLCSSGKY